MNKAERQKLIRDFITNHEVEQQIEIVNMLAERGQQVTQATISRDIKDMQLLKIPDSLGGMKYSLPLERHLNVDEKLQRALNTSLNRLRRHNEFLYLETVPGSASALATLIMQKRYSEVFGKSTDDDSILLICNSSEAAKQLEEIFKFLIKK
ncbi:arginine repressor [Agrilactobacillus fermenti]|uniref:arginine repressor n=1 Tax=Agrilactobacillus fermenti TaxID=2586909 RepID=UPI001E566526|nr:ArgR family transcriptional regulator [Agrilactobacillus fermenti]MCD2256212.1 ArgR family transcriptional regulator [Agrilactobacillus fermenti]